MEYFIIVINKKMNKFEFIKFYNYFEKMFTQMVLKSTLVGKLEYILPSHPLIHPSTSVIRITISRSDNAQTISFSFQNCISTFKARNV